MNIPAPHGLDRIRDAIAAIKNAQMVIMIDDENRENEGDLVFAASDTTPDKINFMIKEARGLVCLALAPEIVERLKLPMMVDLSKEKPKKDTNFTMSIEAKTGVYTGISPADRARTILVATADDATDQDIVIPGHTFPLKAKPGGVLERAGHTEGSIDLMLLAGKKPAAVICEIINADGSMARLKDLKAFSEKFSIPILTIEDLIAYRMQQQFAGSQQRSYAAR